MKALQDMSTGELESYLSSLNQNLDEAAVEAKYVLGQTGIHISSRTVRNYEDEMDTLKKRIEEVHAVLDAKTLI